MLTFLWFEGPDKAGKGSLINEVNKVANYKYFCVDRSLGSAYVYDALYKRPDREAEIKHVEQQLCGLSDAQVIVVFVTADTLILERRIKEEDAFAQDRLKRLQKAVDLYMHYKNNICQLPIVTIDTSVKTITECAHELLLQLEQKTS